MVHFNRRRLRGRRLVRPGRPARPASSAPEPLSLPEDRSGESTVFDVGSVGAPKANSHETTVALPSVRVAAPQREQAHGTDGPPPPPKRLEFSCSCGTVLVATPATYDKHTRCAMCQTVMLLNVVYDPERDLHEIVPFQINPDLGP